MLKRVILIVLFVFVCCISVFSLSACNSASKLKFAFVTDTHIVANGFFSEENFSEYTSVDKMVHLSDAIFNSLADELIENKTKTLLMGGDLTENGDLLSHQACIKTLNRLKDAGVNVFVINGNHDIAQKLSATSKITPSEFSELYSDFGYNVAISKHPNSLSYSADINEKYRLIAIDNIGYEIDETITKEELSKEHEFWVFGEVSRAMQDGKTPIIIGHKPFLQHFPKITEAFMERSYYNACKKFVKTLADKGCNFSFTGHMHMQDAKDVASERGNVFTDITSCSTAFYPSSYRMVTFKNKEVDIVTKQVDIIKAEYLSQFVSSEEKSAILNDFRKYCEAHFHQGVSSFVKNFAEPNGRLSGKFNGDMQVFMDILLPEVLAKFINNPFYIKDEDNNISLERILSVYNINVPKSSYTSIADLAPFYVAALMGGDENIEDGVENTLLKLAVKSMFYYLDEQADNIKTALPDYEKINIDLDKLFNEGILECYDSKLVPVFLAVLGSSIDNSLLNSILGSINTSFEPLISFESAINIYTNNQLTGILIYFVTNDIRIDALLDAIFERYVTDLMLDTPPADNNLTVKR